jgi:hypothetical protein
MHYTHTQARKEEHPSIGNKKRHEIDLPLEHSRAMAIERVSAQREQSI